MELTAAEAWSRILERARPLLPEHTFRIWLEHTEPVALSQDELTVAAGSDFAAEWIEDKYGGLLTEVAERVFGRAIALGFENRDQGGPGPGAAGGAGGPHDGRSDADASGATASALGSSTATAGPARGQGSSAPSVAGSSMSSLAGHGAGSGTPAPPASAHQGRGGVVLGSPLNERYTFERFVVGANNQLSNAACRAVAEAPARMYNPLFIYGGVGLGKTHLMHAIGHVLLGRDAHKRVAYVSSERFTNDLIASIQEGRMAEFRRRYRDIDLLLIDDVHFLGEKERTQEEFFHTFNALHDAQRQIVMTSDRPPKEIPGLEERLVSRFEWGLVTDIKPPDLETRVAILRKKAEDDRISLGDEVLDYIARNCRSNVRELEGAVIKLLAYSSLTRREVDLDLAREALGGVLGAGAAVEVTADLIRSRVAEEWGVSVDGLTSKRRTKELSVPRQVAMYLMRELLDLSLVEIGRHFGGRDHSTVIHAVNKVEEDLRTEDAFRTRVELLRDGMRG
ncbi:MAG TPA: chromosomal replication initiator protein DnaA [Longimicrobiales bacterium]|nr:chromosomal replication initiator protein DnaA [Longimicrobiales bacterium]